MIRFSIYQAAPVGAAFLLSKPDGFDKPFSSQENTRIIISQIEAVLPRPKEEEKEALQKEGGKESQKNIPITH